VLKELRVHKVIQGLKGQQVLRVLWVLRELWVLRVLQDMQEHKVRQDH